jgi:hypothetical protein
MSARLAVGLALLVPALLLAQFGHPLDGQWSGEWALQDKPVRLLLDLDWDGTTISGRINPGQPSEAAITKVTIDYSDVGSWAVKIEAAGNIAVDARLENIGAYRRVLRGTWTQGGRKAAFTVTRN